MVFIHSYKSIPDKGLHSLNIPTYGIRYETNCSQVPFLNWKLDVKTTVKLKGSSPNDFHRYDTQPPTHAQCVCSCNAHRELFEVEFDCELATKSKLLLLKWID